MPEHNEQNHDDEQQAQATGQRFATLAAGAARSAVRLSPGPVTFTREQFCIPLQNNGFIALAAAG